ncbi:MAG: SpoIID/LytB domain-containing protein [Acidobacteriales bacterium]|nr:SpoIID/LytB domain-containing protein [Terriglobales bacterium]
MKRGVTVCVLWLSVFAAAQQPDIRVRLFTLYTLKEVTVVPVNAARFRRDRARKRAFREPIVIQAINGESRGGTQGNSTAQKSGVRGSTAGVGMTVRGEATRAVVLEGEYRLRGEKISSAALQGKLTITAQTGQLKIVKDYAVEDYVAAVLQGESAGNMPAEALKAMAVAIRSYATRFRERHKAEGFDFCDTTHCQFLRQEVSAPVKVAVQETAGTLLWDRGTALAAYYHKDCGGQTEAAGTVWPDQRSGELVSVADPYCRRDAQTWRAEITGAELGRALRSAGIAVPGRFTHVTVAERTASGRAAMLEFDGARVSASSVRFAVGRAMGWQELKSDWYQVEAHGDRFIFSGRGVGHGVGLCQSGAAEMAWQDKSYRDILNFYYAGAPIGRSAQGIPWSATQGVGIELRVVNPGDVAAAAAVQKAVATARRESGLAISQPVVVEIYPSVQMFRDATGEPGWVAASTRGQTIRVQPPAVLGARLGPVMRHEALHVMVEANAKAGTPLWYREGLVMELGGEGSSAAASGGMSAGEIDRTLAERSEAVPTREAYAAARAGVARLQKRYGQERLVYWLREGLPAEVMTEAFASPRQ